MKDGKKKSLLKKWWVWLIAVVIIFGVAGGNGEEEKSLDNSSNITNVTTNNTDKKEEKESIKEPVKEQEKEPEVKKEKPIKNGTYKVGADLAAGEYLFIAKGMGYIEASSDSTGTLESIVFNDNVKGHSYITVNEGEYLKINGGELYPVATAPSVIPSNGLYKDGMYKVGQDIPAGEYKVTLTSSIAGYYEVTNDSRHLLQSIITNENVQGDTYLTISEGQYLKISGVQIQK